MSPYQPLWLEPELWLEPAPSQALVPEVCELHHPKPPQNWSCKSLPGFDLAHGSSSGFCCNQRAFLTFFFFFFLAEAARQNSGLSTSCFPSALLLSFPVWLVGRGMPPWKESWAGVGRFFQERLWSAASLRAPGIKEPERLLCFQSQALFPTSSWPQKLPFGASQFLCLFWPRPLLLLLLIPSCGHAPGALPSATSTRNFSPCPWWDGAQGPAREGHLRPTHAPCWGSHFPPQGNHFPSHYPLAMGVNRESHLCSTAGFWDEQELVCPTSWIGSQDGGLEFKGQMWHTMQQSSCSTAI